MVVGSSMVLGSYYDVATVKFCVDPFANSKYFQFYVGICVQIVEQILLEVFLSLLFWFVQHLSLFLNCFVFYMWLKLGT